MFKVIWIDFRKSEVSQDSQKLNRNFSNLVVLFASLWDERMIWEGKFWSDLSIWSYFFRQVICFIAFRALILLFIYYKYRSICFTICRFQQGCAPCCSSSIKEVTNFFQLCFCTTLLVFFNRIIYNLVFVVQ